jgi:hypothetical protein
MRRLDGEGRSGWRDVESLFVREGGEAAALGEHYPAVLPIRPSALHFGSHSTPELLYCALASLYCDRHSSSSSHMQKQPAPSKRFAGYSGGVQTYFTDMLQLVTTLP